MRPPLTNALAASSLLAIQLAGLPAARAAEPATPATGAATNPEQRLEQRLEQAERRIRDLEARLERAEAAAANPPAPPAPAPQLAETVTQASRNVTITSGDNSDTLRLGGSLAVDDRQFTDAATPASASMMLARRVRPMVEGTLGNDYQFRLMPDFAGGRSVLLESWASAHVRPWLTLQGGKFKTPLGLERLQKDQFVRFIELGLPSALEPGRDFGVQANGSFRDGAVNYWLGWFDGAMDGNGSDANLNPDQDNDGKRDWVGRLFLQPFTADGGSALQGLGFGIGASYTNANGVTGTSTNTLLPTYKTPGQQPMFSYRADLASTTSINEATLAQGLRRRLAPQAQYYVGPLGLFGQYTSVSQQVQRSSASGLASGTLEHHGWLLTASWFLTGEDAASETFAPNSPLRPGKSGTGAVELVARIHGLSFDAGSFAGGAASFADPTASVRAVRAYGAGLNWYLNGSFKLQFNYEYTRFSGGATVGDRPAERVAITRAAVNY